MGIKRSREDSTAGTSSPTVKSFDLGELGMVQADCDPKAASALPLAQRMPIGGILHLPNNLWSGWTTGTSVCRVEGFAATMPNGKKRKPGAPSFVVRTLEDGWCYPFTPSALSKAVREGQEIVHADLQTHPEWASVMVPSSDVPAMTLPSSSQASTSGLANSYEDGRDAADDPLPMLSEVEVDALQWLADADAADLPYVPEEVD